MADDTTPSTTCYQSKLAHEIINKLFKSIPLSYFNSDGDKCFCLNCHQQRKDQLIYSRGKPSKLYGIPVEWIRFGLQNYEPFCEMNNVWTDWHIAYHGTNKENIYDIFKGGLQLLKPNDITINGLQLGIKGGHIPQPFERINYYTNSIEIFDPNQIFFSPSIKYAANNMYSKSFEYIAQNNKKYNIKFAFQLRVKPDTYGIGQETTNAKTPIDYIFNNNELEWYTNINSAIVLTGLLLNIKQQISIPHPDMIESIPIVQPPCIPTQPVPIVCTPATVSCIPQSVSYSSVRNMYPNTYYVYPQPTMTSYTCRYRPY